MANIKKSQINKNLNRYFAWSILFPFALIKLFFDVCIAILGMPVLVMKHIDNTIETENLYK